VIVGIASLFLLNFAVLVFVLWRGTRAYNELLRRHRQLRQRCYELAKLAAVHEPEKVSCYWGVPMIHQRGGGWKAYDAVDEDGLL